MAFRRARAPGSLSSHVRQRRRKAHCPARGGCACALRPSLVSCNLWRHSVRYARHARGWNAYGARTAVPSHGKLPCASGAYGTQEAGTRTLYARHGCSTLWLYMFRTACERGQCCGVGEAEGLGHQLGKRVASSVVIELARLSQRLGWRSRLLYASFEGPCPARLAARSVCAPGALLLRVSDCGVARRRGRHLHRWFHAVGACGRVAGLARPLFNT